MAILSKLKNLFLPSDTVADQRRLNILGTSSETKATLAVATGAGLLAAAPALLPAAARGFSSLSTAKKAATITTAAITAPAIIGGVARDPTIISKAPAAYMDFAGASYSSVKTGSAEPLVSFVGDHPIASTIGGGVLLAGGAILTGKAAQMLFGAYQQSKLSGAAKDISETLQNMNKDNNFNLPSVPPPPPQNTPPVQNNGMIPQNPTLPQTQTMGSLTVRKKYRKPVQHIQKQSVRVNIINASRLYGIGKYKYMSA